MSFHYPTWGMSWGGSWGSSWGPIEVEERRGGGIGHGKEGKKKQKRAVVEKGGKLLLFRNAHDAAEFLQNDKRTEPGKVVKEKKKKQVKPIEVIDLEVVKKYQQEIVEFIPEAKTERLIDLGIEVLLIIAAKLREWEEDDIEILLMAA